MKRQESIIRFVVGLLPGYIIYIPHVFVHNTVHGSEIPQNVDMPRRCFVQPYVAILTCIQDGNHWNCEDIHCFFMLVDTVDGRNPAPVNR